ncbi:heme oxygenase-like protein [Delitschia confertaspora ATCC 74209]|uniref:Heme oxygenase-like protein n=1 Tax=Delitschia confertaspora ATCC 74209 TaxID=1513339 RepID=A0A9P4JU57_9PLEO|nr:heme oxygenase-like protein [Delitschia confertaspora ATCC 74209]
MAKDVAAPDSLSSQINTATRAAHASLNRLITSRLPLALPPYVTNNDLYATGILHFAHVYFTFESCWADLLPSSSQAPTSPLLSFLLVDPWDGTDPFSTEQKPKPPSPEMLGFLRDLRPKGLVRSGRLKQDLELLTGFEGTDLSLLLSQFPGTKVQEYCTHIRRVVAQKPHVLVAYAWCYYMAIFSGGRWIRGELLRAGEEFWGGGADKDGEKVVPLEEKGLALWHFDGDDDGEDIKAEFKRRLEAAETLFTPEERQDAIDEARNIFKYSVELVQELDERLGTKMDQVSPSGKVGIPSKDKSTGTHERKIFTLRRASALITRPEVTGAVVVLGFLAYMGMSGFNLRELL